MLHEKTKNSHRDSFLVQENMPQITPNANQGNKNFSPSNTYDILGVMGFSFYLAWIFLMIIDVLHANSFSDTIAIGVVPFFFLGQFVAAGVLWFFSRHLSSRRSVIPLCIFTAIILPLPGIAVLLSSVFGNALPIIWFAAGFAGLCLLALWGVFLSGLDHRSATLYPPLAVLGQSFMILFILFLFRAEIMHFVMIIVPWVSIGLCFAWWRSALRDNRVEFFDNAKPPDVEALLRSAVAMVANNFLIGFVLYSISIAENEIVGVVVLLVMICASGLKTYDATHKHRFEVREIIRVLAPTAAVGLLLLPYISIELRITCIVFMMFIATLDEVVCWSAVSEYMHVYKLTPFANMAFGRLGDTIGCFLGYCCAFLVFGSSLDGEINSPIILCIVVIFFIVMQIYFFRDNYSPFTEHRKAELNDEKEFTAVNSGGRWKERCNRFADYHELTPRQRETLIPLAKGYSTKTIEKMLFVSSHTVKAHVYNIYRKAGVHTRQELIEMIENFDFEENEKDDTEGITPIS